MSRQPAHKAFNNFRVLTSPQGGKESHMRSLIGRITGAEQRSIDAARWRYSELLMQGNEDEATETEIATLMEKLGKSAADLQADYQEVEKMKTALAAIEDGCGLGQAITDAQAKVTAHGEETTAIIAQRNGKLAKLNAEANQLGQRYIEADRAQHAVNAMRKKRPDLFDSIPVLVVT